MFIGMSQATVNSDGIRGNGEGNKLKSNSGWPDGSNGSDKFGFKALPCGFRHYDDESFETPSDNAHWYSGDFHRSQYYYNTEIGRYQSNKAYGYSVRCVKD